MRRNYLVLLLLLLTPLFLFAQEGELSTDSATAPAEPDSVGAVADSVIPVDTIPVVRTAFSTLVDDMTNQALIESRGQLESMMALSSGVSGEALIRLDSFPDEINLEISIGLEGLSTGNFARDSLVFCKEYLDFDTLTTAAIKMLRITQTKEHELWNEQPLEATGIGEFFLGEFVDTVVVTLKITYLEENEVTNTAKPGQLLHVRAQTSFLMSDFGIKIPREALLRLDDRIWVTAEVFLSAPTLTE